MIHEVDCGNELKKICNIENTEITKIKSYIEAKKLNVSFYNNGQNVCGDDDSWALIRRLGEESAFGDAYLSTCSKDKQKSYVFKIIHNLENYSDRIKRFNNEVSYQTRASELGVSSPIYQVFMDKSKKFGMFVMDLYAMTVQRFFIEQLELSNPNLNLLQRIFDRCFEISHLLDENGIAHNDQHLNNFMLVSTNELDLDDVNTNIKIIDFGDATKDTSQSRLTIVLKIINGIYNNEKNEFENIHENNIHFFNGIKRELNRLKSILEPEPPETIQSFLSSTCGTEIIEFYDAVENYLDYGGPHPKKIPKFSNKNTRDIYSQIIENNEKKFGVVLIKFFRDAENSRRD
jgi:tRNA A-37 threonylcarbamoyl transferase component Bud32